LIYSFIVFIHLFNHSLIHVFIDILISTISHLFIYLFIYLFIHLFIICPIRYFINIVFNLCREADILNLLTRAHVLIEGKERIVILIEISQYPLHFMEVHVWVTVWIEERRVLQNIQKSVPVLISKFELISVVVHHLYIYIY